MTTTSNVLSQIRKEISTAEISNTTRNLLEIMAKFNEVHNDFWEWLASYYGEESERQKEFSVAYEGMYFYIEETLCNVIQANMNTLPFNGI